MKLPCCVCIQAKSKSCETKFNRRNFYYKQLTNVMKKKVIKKLFFACFKKKFCYKSDC
jgi:hypothetical protein